MFFAICVWIFSQNRLRRKNEQQRLQTLHDLLVIGVYMVTVINILAATITEV